MVVWLLLLVAPASLFVVSHATNLTLNQKLTFDSLDLENDEVRLRRDASWAADDASHSTDTQLKAFKSDNQKTGSVMGGSYFNGYGTDSQPDMQMWQGGQLGSTATGQEMSSYPQSYGTMTGGGSGNPNSPYAGYLEKQISTYPVMIYTLNGCEPCQRAKQLIATSYPDARAHYLELSGSEAWQQQLQMDLQYLTGYSELYELHENGQLRRMLNQSLKVMPKH